MTDEQSSDLQDDLESLRDRVQGVLEWTVQAVQHAKADQTEEVLSATDKIDARLLQLLQMSRSTRMLAMGAKTRLPSPLTAERAQRVSDRLHSLEALADLTHSWIREAIDRIGSGNNEASIITAARIDVLLVEMLKLHLEIRELAA